MNRQAFASAVGGEVGVDPITILTALSILATTLPSLIQLCTRKEKTPEEQVKKACMNNPTIARWEIRKTLHGVRVRDRHRVAESIRKKIAAMSTDEIRGIMSG